MKSTEHNPSSEMETLFMIR